MKNKFWVALTILEGETFGVEGEKFSDWMKKMKQIKVMDSEEFKEAIFMAMQILEDAGKQGEKK